MIGDRYMALPLLEKNTLYEETIRDKKKNVQIPDVSSPTSSLSRVVSADSVSIGRCEMFPEKIEMRLFITEFPDSNHIFGWNG